MDKLKVGVAGLRRGISFFNTFRHYEKTEVVAICDSDEQRAKEIATADNIKSWYIDFEKFLEHDFDIAVIATPLPLHVKQSIQALEAGKHVLSEVPPANSLDEARQLVQAVKKAKGLKYMMAENMNYMHFLREWIKIVNDGRLGKIFYAEAEYIHSIPQLMINPDGTPTWRASLPPIYYCTHSLGPLISMMKERFVSAIGQSTGSNVAPERGTIDMEIGLLKSESGAVVKILCGFSIERGKGHHYFSIYGTNGCLETNRHNWTEEAYAYFKDDPQKKLLTPIKISINDPDAPQEAKLGGHGTSEYYLVRDFVQSILDDTTPPIDIYTALDFGLPGLCAHKSAMERGKVVEIPNPRKW